MSTEIVKKVKPDQCGNCKFGKDGGIVQYDIRIIACRRYPPQQGDRQDRSGPYPHPMVKETEWCGEHLRKEQSSGKEKE